MPSTVSHFCGRRGINILPTKLNLFNRRIIQSPTCHICSREVKTLMHAVWRCPAAGDVWAERSPVQKMASNGSEFLELWKSLRNTLKLEQPEKTAIIMRGI